MLSLSMRRFSIVFRSFPLFLPLHIGVELILGVGIFNKASGLYGILSIFTGHPLSPVEWVLNLVSLSLLPLYVITYLNFAKKDALRMLTFAYVYVFDTFINLGLTIFFCVHWFTSVSHNVQGSVAGVSSTVMRDAVTTVGEVAREVAREVAISGSLSTMSETVGEALTTASEATVPTATSFGEAVTTATAAVTAIVTEMAVDVEKRANKDMNKSATLPQETAVSITITVSVLLVRFYFTFVTIGYARQLVRQQNLRKHNGEPAGSLRSKV